MSFISQITNGFITTQSDTNTALIKACDTLYKSQKEIAKSIEELNDKVHKVSTDNSFQGSSIRVNAREIEALKSSQNSIQTVQEVVTTLRQLYGDMMDSHNSYVMRVEHLETEMKNMKYVITEFVRNMERAYPTPDDQI